MSTTTIIDLHLHCYTFPDVNSNDKQHKRTSNYFEDTSAEETSAARAVRLERLTSSFVEGFNNRVKVLKRRCYGIFDVGRLFQRLTLDIHGYQRFSLT